MSLCQIKRAFFIPAVLWMLIIFIFSAMPEDISEEQSDYVSIRLQKIIMATLSGNKEEAKNEWDEWSEESPRIPVRKMAHVIEYAVLCMLLYVGLAGGKHAGLLSVLLTVLYAVTDEVHQLFVPGRAGLFVDVLIDSIGAGVGLVLILLLGRVIRSRKERMINRICEMPAKRK